MATVGAVCNMQTNQLYLTLIDPNVYDRLIVVKPHMSSMEIRDYPGFIEVCYSDSRAERKSDGESSIDTQPERSFKNRFEATIDKNLEASIDSWADEDHRERFVNSTATHTKRKICVVQLAEYGVYTDEDGNAQTMDGKIINVSKEEIEAILEMDDKSGGKYLSLPQYEGCFQMPGVRPPVHYPPASSYNKDNIEELLNDISTSRNKMFDEFYENIDDVYFPMLTPLQD